MDFSSDSESQERTIRYSSGLAIENSPCHNRETECMEQQKLLSAALFHSFRVLFIKNMQFNSHGRVSCFEIAFSLA
jgi:hypothetical protein